ncbi:CHAT domain-containing protein [Dendryphion nanum]|uniref:CHAT domain-containing protein n=1 Tax=Dendryphion nanum TaxID=256645 RepID=A0A9P9DVC7_9PLEO|nr:CHAT domain-containing protein [Dendryphion nanum]
MATEKRNKFDRAVSLCFAARDWERGISGVQDMLQRDSTRLDDMKSSTDPHIWYNMVHMACVLEQSGDIGLALEWYLSAFHVVETNLQQLAAINDRRKTRSTVSSRELFIGMARIAFRFSKASDSTCGPSQWNLTPAEWKDQGLRFLELGRSRTLLDLLIIQKLSPPDSKVWSKYSYQLRLKVKESSTNDTTESKSQDCIDKEPEIREKYLERIYGELMDGLESPSPSQLLPEPAAVRESNEKLYQCIPETAIVLHISSSREGLIILCITSQGIIDIYTAEITDLQLDRHIFRLAKLFRDVSSLPAIAICNQHLQAISDEIIVPVSQHIETKEHVIFIPSPSLNKFPLCALIYKKKPLFMSKDVSQLPSLSALQYTVEKKRYVSEKSSVVYKDPESTHGGAFDISTPVAIEMAASFRAKPEPATKTFTKDKFMEVYQQSDVLLIATHGDQSTKLAWESSILLHPPFQVLDLARLHSNATLNIVEACMSGLREESIVDELLGLSHAFLASGATTFLGGLREVSDKASALLMLFLAEEVKTSKRSKSLARCWRNAQMRLYDLNVEREVAILKDIKNYLGTSQAKLIDKELVAQFGQAVEDVIMGLQELGANSPRPFYWTPFVLMGHSGLVLDFEGVVEAISLGIVPGDEGDQAY